MAVTFFEVSTLGEAGQILLSFGGSINGLLSDLLGGFDPSLKWLIYLMIVDFFTGLYAGVKTTGWESSKCSNGLQKKIIILMLVSVSVAVGYVAEMPMLRQLVIVAYMVNEFGSIIENFELAGYGHLIPKPLRYALKVFKDREKIMTEKIEGKEVKK